ncbi:MAG: hypothetical protein U0514_02485 [Candidatus Andersenbacteria bacterium]
MHFPKRWLIAGLVVVVAAGVGVGLYFLLRGGTFCGPSGLQHQRPNSGVQYFCVESNISKPVAVNAPFTYRFSVVTTNGVTFKNYQLAHERLMHLHDRPQRPAVLPARAPRL